MEKDAKKFIESENSGLETETATLKDVVNKLANWEKTREDTDRTCVLIGSDGPTLTAVSKANITNDSEVEEHQMPALLPDQIVDSYGADDAFIGGFLAAYQQNKPFADCIKAGTHMHTAVLKRMGVTFPETMIVLPSNSKDAYMELLTVTHNNFKNNPVKKTIWVSGCSMQGKTTFVSHLRGDKLMAVSNEDGDEFILTSEQ